VAVPRHRREGARQQRNGADIWQLTPIDHIHSWKEPLSLDAIGYGTNSTTLGSNNEASGYP
jgi:hypothetical protein